MKFKTGFYFDTATIVLILALAGPSTQLHAQAPASIAIDANNIGGVVTGPNGPEAGVWVIAETKDLPTRFAKIVVTDDQGRYVLPDLPKARYQIWVRGYGLVDSPKVESEPGKQLDLAAVIAPNAAPHVGDLTFQHIIPHCKLSSWPKQRFLIDLPEVGQQVLKASHNLPPTGRSALNGATSATSYSRALVGHNLRVRQARSARCRTIFLGSSVRLPMFHPPTSPSPGVRLAIC